MRCATLVLLVIPNAAFADEPTSLHEGLTRESSEPFLRVDEALLNLDTMMRSNTLVHGSAPAGSTKYPSAVRTVQIAVITMRKRP